MLEGCLEDGYQLLESHYLEVVVGIPPGGIVESHGLLHCASVVGQARREVLVVETTTRDHGC